jgi:hypothetical protein
LSKLYVILDSISGLRPVGRSIVLPLTKRAWWHPQLLTLIFERVSGG